MRLDRLPAAYFVAIGNGAQEWGGAVSLLRFVFMPIVGGKIYLNCRWHLFFFIHFSFLPQLFRIFCDLFFLAFASKKDFVFFSVFVILWNVLSSLF